ncbi:MAG: Rossmann-like and DUF2520 domain-containing protein [Acidobacteriota bacterium]
MKKFSIVGAGRLGTSLAAALVRRGWELEVVADRDVRAARESRRIIGRGRVSASLAAAAAARGLVIIAVPDDAVGRAAASLARAGGPWAGRVVLHTSGLLPSSVLGPLARRGASAASLHPVQAFPRKDLPASVFAGITWGVEGGAAAVEAAETIVRALRGRVLLVAAGDKALYHAACVLASNALVALESTAAGLLERTGLDAEAAAATLAPLLQGTLQNVKSLGLEKALTGPILRGDLKTVRRHLEALKGAPREREVYAVLGGRILSLAAKRGLPPGRVRAMRRLLEDR